jgi:very-short-patch-repair endonuclease
MQARQISAVRASLVASRARQMRFALTPSEQKLWSEIAGCWLGVRFRRQVPIGRYVVDFLAPQVRLVVEVDGEYHSRRKGLDARRDEALRRWGYHVLRLDAELVEREVAVAVERVREEIGGLRGEGPRPLVGAWAVAGELGRIAVACRALS